MIGAHQDHIGGKLLGANDNASGVTALLAIADARVTQAADYDLAASLEL